MNQLFFEIAKSSLRGILKINISNKESFSQVLKFENEEELSVMVQHAFGVVFGGT